MVEGQATRQQIGQHAHLLQVAVLFWQVFEPDTDLLANDLLLLRRGKQVACRARRRLLDDAPPRQEVERRQQVSIAQDGENLARLRRPAFLRAVDLRPALCLYSFLCCGSGFSIFSSFGYPSRGSPMLAGLAPVCVSPYLVLFLVLKGIDAVAAHHLCQPRLAAHVREAFNALALRILDKVQLIIQKVIMVEGNGALLMHN